MATSGSTLVQRTRRLVRDWPEEDVLTASVSSSATSITIADGTIYPTKMRLEIEQEALLTTAAGSGTTVAVRRGIRGSTAATHANASTILINPRFYSVEILDALNQALDACFPLLYKPITDTSLSGDGSTYEFTIPTMSSLSAPIPYIHRIDLKIAGDNAYRRVRNFEIVRDAAPVIKFRSPPSANATIRIHGYGPFAHLSSVSSSLDDFFPKNAEFLLSDFAASQLLISGEAARVREQTGVLDSRENANQTGSSMRAAENFRNRFYTQLQQAAMSPMARHRVSVI